ncbi:MAG: hypothetical protein BGO00_02545 [Alphaproteobacteria bacterium 62-8]|nr:MAG: hypothetical protein BGO00_02545 [Alphaproteobacteria bacterium 62-8]
MRKHTDEPEITLAQMALNSRWIWVHCNGCGRHKAARIATLIEHLGPDASYSRAQRALKCSQCGRSKPTFTVPSWESMQQGWQEMPKDAL